MLENMFDQETVTRNENLRHYREGIKESTERFVKAMLLEGDSDSKIMRCTGISKQELEALKQSLK